ncbi:MAG: DUF4832 domain-containing protein [Desulfamplus sp.]|nr:DUF4832 domain-containing protein [Desulfamplus sp.]
MIVDNNGQLLSTSDSVNNSTVNNIANSGTVTLGGTYEYNPPELDKPVFNQGCGLTYPTWIGDWSLYESIKPYTDIAYSRFTWDQLEPQEGVYKFDIIKSWITTWKAKGFNRFAFGVMSTTIGSQATPLWVFDSGVPGVSHMNGKQIDPVYWNELYLQKIQNFIKAMGNEFNQNKDIEFLDMRNIGVWGEMHFGNGASGMWTDEELLKNGYSGEVFLKAYQSMISSYQKSFPNIQLFLNIAPYQNTIVNYATNGKINLRYDGLNLADGKSMGPMSKYFINYGYPRVAVSENKYSMETSVNQVLNPSGEKSLDGWISMNGINLSQAQDEGVKISGEQNGDWNYARIKLVDEKLIPGEKYRIEGLIKVRTISNSLMKPYLKLQANNSNNQFVKNYFSNKYDALAMNTWQSLSAEFQAGSTETKGLLGIEKGIKELMSIEMYAKNFSLTRISNNDLVANNNVEDATENNGLSCSYEFAGIEDNIINIQNIFSIGLADPVSYINLNYLPRNKGLSYDATKIIEDAAKKIGYRFILEKISCPAVIDVNPKNMPTILELEQVWKNKGNAPCYRDYVLKFTITDSNDNSVLEFQETPQVPTWKWFPEKQISIKSSIKIPVDIKEGRYVLKIGLLDPLTSKAIMLPLDGFDGKAYYKLIELQVNGGKMLVSSAIQ